MKVKKMYYQLTIYRRPFFGCEKINPETSLPISETPQMLHNCSNQRISW